MMNVLLVAIGGAVGASLRYLVSSVVVPRFGTEWPVATFSVNVLGSMLLGMLVGWLSIRGGEGSAQLRLLLGTGLLGGFTTFSAYSLEVVQMIETGRWGAAGGYAFGSVILGLVAVFVGLWIARRMFA